MNQLTKRSVGLVYRNLPVYQTSCIRLDHGEAKPRKWQRWQDVPDEWVLPSTRMPDNPYYTTEKWKAFKKKQIFYQQDDGIPVYLKRSNAYNSLYILMIVLTVYCGYGAISKMLDGHVFPKKKKE